MILASASPRRAELMKELFGEFEIVPADADESAGENSPSAAAETAAVKKARAVSDALNASPAGTDGVLILACDTVVCLGGEIFGKPKDADEAFATLKKLNGKTHSVYSGVCVVNGGKETRFHDASRVKFKDNSDAELRAYIEDFKPFDKAGGYGIQDGRLVENFEGSLKNIIGLPVEKIKEKLKEIQ